MVGTTPFTTTMLPLKSLIILDFSNVEFEIKILQAPIHVFNQWLIALPGRTLFVNRGNVRLGGIEGRRGMGSSSIRPTTGHRRGWFGNETNTVVNDETFADTKS